MLKKKIIGIVNKKDKNCGVYDFTLKALSTLDNKDSIININQISNFRKISSNQEIILNYTPLYWINPIKILFLILIFSSFKKKEKPKINLIIHDYIRPRDYSKKFNLLLPYLSFTFEYLFKIADKVFCLSRPTGKYKKYISNNKKTKILFVPSNFIVNEKPYSKKINFDYLNLLMFGSKQAYQNKDSILLLEEYLSSFDKNFKIRLILLGSVREICFPNIKKLNISIIRFPYLRNQKVSQIFKNSAYCLFFHQEGISERSGILSAAMQHGLPIIALKGLATESHLNNIKGLFLFKKDELIKAVNYSTNLLNNKNNYLETSDSLIKYYNKNKSWVKFKENFLN